MKIGRRKLLVFGSSLFLASTTIGCSVNNSNDAGNQIVSNADEALENLFSISPESYTIYEKSAGTLIMPKITKAGFIFGGSYGEGILFIKDAAVEHYSIATASYGLELGASIFSQALIFMSPNALKEFRTTDGWELSADAYYTYKQSGKNLGISSNTLNFPIFEIVYSQTGLSAGASLKGAKYSRLIR